jgi:hypothetical protein
MTGSEFLAIAAFVVAVIALVVAVARGTRR